MSKVTDWISQKWLTEFQKSAYPGDQCLQESKFLLPLRSYLRKKPVNHPPEPAPPLHCWCLSHQKPKKVSDCSRHYIPSKPDTHLTLKKSLTRRKAADTFGSSSEQKTISTNSNTLTSRLCSAWPPSRRLHSLENAPSPQTSPSTTYPPPTRNRTSKTCSNTLTSQPRKSPFSEMRRAIFMAVFESTSPHQALQKPSYPKKGSLIPSATSQSPSPRTELYLNLTAAQNATSLDMSHQHVPNQTICAQIVANPTTPKHVPPPPPVSTVTNNTHRTLQTAQPSRHTKIADAHETNTPLAKHPPKTPPPHAVSSHDNLSPTHNPPQHSNPSNTQSQSSTASSPDSSPRSQNWMLRLLFLLGMPILMLLRMLLLLLMLVLMMELLLPLSLPWMSAPAQVLPTHQTPTHNPFSQMLCNEQQPLHTLTSLQHPHHHSQLLELNPIKQPTPDTNPNFLPKETPPHQKHNPNPKSTVTNPHHTPNPLPKQPHPNPLQHDRQHTHLSPMELSIPHQPHKMPRPHHNSQVSPGRRCFANRSLVGHHLSPTTHLPQLHTLPQSPQDFLPASARRWFCNPCLQIYHLPTVSPSRYIRNCLGHLTPPQPPYLDSVLLLHTTKYTPLPPDTPEDGLTTDPTSRPPPAPDWRLQRPPHHLGSKPQPHNPQQTRANSQQISQQTHPPPTTPKTPNTPPHLPTPTAQHHRPYHNHTIPISQNPPPTPSRPPQRSHPTPFYPIFPTPTHPFQVHLENQDCVARTMERNDQHLFPTLPPATPTLNQPRLCCCTPHKTPPVPPRHQHPKDYTPQAPKTLPLVDQNPNATESSSETSETKVAASPHPPHPHHLHRPQQSILQHPSPLQNRLSPQPGYKPLSTPPVENKHLQTPFTPLKQTLKTQDHTSFPTGVTSTRNNTNPTRESVRKTLSSNLQRHQRTTHLFPPTHPQPPPNQQTQVPPLLLTTHPLQLPFHLSRTHDSSQEPPQHLPWTRRHPQLVSPQRWRFPGPQPTPPLQPVLESGQASSSLETCPRPPTPQTPPRPHPPLQLPTHLPTPHPRQSFRATCLQPPLLRSRINPLPPPTPICLPEKQLNRTTSPAHHLKNPKLPQLQETIYPPHSRSTQGLRHSLGSWTMPQTSQPAEINRPPTYLAHRLFAQPNYFCTMWHHPLTTPYPPKWYTSRLSTFCTPFLHLHQRPSTNHPYPNLPVCRRHLNLTHPHHPTPLPHPSPKNLEHHHRLGQQMASPVQHRHHEVHLHHLFQQANPSDLPQTPPSRQHTPTPLPHTPPFRSQFRSPTQLQAPHQHHHHQSDQKTEHPEENLRVFLGTQPHTFVTGLQDLCPLNSYLCLELLAYLHQTPQTPPDPSQQRPTSHPWGTPLNTYPHPLSRTEHTPLHPPAVEESPQITLQNVLPPQTTSPTTFAPQQPDPRQRPQTNPTTLLQTTPPRPAPATTPQKPRSNLTNFSTHPIPTLVPPTCPATPAPSPPDTHTHPGGRTQSPPPEHLLYFPQREILPHSATFSHKRFPAQRAPHQSSQHSPFSITNRAQQPTSPQPPYTELKLSKMQHPTRPPTHTLHLSSLHDTTKQPLQKDTSDHINPTTLHLDVPPGISPQQHRRNPTGTVPPSHRHIHEMTDIEPKELKRNLGSRLNSRVRLCDSSWNLNYGCWGDFEDLNTNSYDSLKQLRAYTW